MTKQYTVHESTGLKLHLSRNKRQDIQCFKPTAALSIDGNSFTIPTDRELSVRVDVSLLGNI